MPYASFANLHKKDLDQLFIWPFLSGQKVKYSTKTANGVTLGNETTNKGGKLATKMSAKYKDASGFNVKKFEIASKHELKTDITMDNTGIPGLTATLNVKLAKDADGDESFIGFEYNHAAFNLMAKGDPVSRAANYSLTTGYEKFIVGAEGSFEGCPNKDSISALAYGYKGKDFSIIGNTQLKDNASKFVVKHSYSDAITFASVLNYGADKKIDMEFASKYQVDKDSSLSTKLVGTAAQVTYSQKMRPNVKVDTCLGFDIGLLSGKSTSAKFGLALEFC